jgi:superfamily II DNA or RNA helicase
VVHLLSSPACSSVPAMTTITVGAMLAAPVESFDPDRLKAAICEARVPNRAFQLAMQRTGRRPFGMPEYFDRIRIEDDRVVCGRALREALRGALLDPSKAEFTDLTCMGEPLPVKFGGTLRPAQQVALSQLSGKRLAMLQAPPGFGKTITAAAYIGTIGRSTLILVPTLELMRQWATELERLLEVAPSILGGGNVEIGAITIATPQSALLHIEKLQGLFGLLIVDEIHLAGSDTYLKLFERIDARYRLGMSGTMDRSDGRFPLVGAHFGPRSGAIVAKRKELEASGVLVAPTYCQVSTGFDFRYSCPADWPAVLEAVHADIQRSDLIRRVVARECRDGIVGLLLCDRIAPLEAHATALTAMGLRVATVYGSLSAKARQAAIEAARTGKIDVLCGSTVADTGLDIPNLSRVFLASPSRAWTRLIQRIGRICRPAPGKDEAIVFDFVDACGPLKAQARARAEAVSREWPSQRGLAA